MSEQQSCSELSGIYYSKDIPNYKGDSRKFNALRITNTSAWIMDNG